MTHKQVLLEGQPGICSTIIYRKEFNLDKKDNLEEIPNDPAVYTVCGRVNGNAVNPRCVSTATNLQEAIKQLYAEANSNDSLLKFMQSIKVKMLVYQVMPGSTENERQQIKQQWENELQPQCTDELNQVY